MKDDDVNVDAMIDAPATYNIWEGPSSTYNSLPQIDPRAQIETPAYSTWAREAARSSQSSQVTSQSSRATSQSSKAPSQSSQTASPEQLPPKPVPVVAEYPQSYPYPAAPSQTQHQPQILSQLRAPGQDTGPDERTTDNRPPKTRLPGHRYLGPKLNDPAEPTDEAAEFEKFKMDTRVAKILEFHSQAAQAEISLAFEIYSMQKKGLGSREKGDETKMIKEQEKRMLEEHYMRMIELQRAKETERKVIVEEERRKRRAEIRQRAEEKRKKKEEAAQAAQTPSWESLIEGQAAPFDVERLERWAAQQEVEAKLWERHGSTASKRVSVSNNHGQLESPRAPRRERRQSQGADFHAQVATTPTPKNNPSNPTAVARKQQNTNRSSQQMQEPVQATGLVVEQTSLSSSSSSKPPNRQLHQGRPENREYWVPAGGLEAKAAPASSSKTQSQGADASRTTLDQIQTASSGGKQSQPVPSRKQQPRAIEIQTEGASSSRTTLDQMGASSSSKPSQRLDNQEIWVPAAAPKSKIKPPLDIQATISSSAQPQVRPDHRQFWVPPADAKATPSRPLSRKVSDPSSLSRSPQIEKANSMPEPQPVHPPIETKRLRRMSAPVSPSPRGLVERGRDDGKGPDNVQGILKDSKTKTSTKTGKPPKLKRVTVEEVSDEDGPGRRKGKGHDRENHPSDSNVIMEPKPSVPPTMFTQIFQYGTGDGGRETGSSMTPPSSSIPRVRNLSTATTSLPDSSPSNGDWFAGESPNENESKNGSLEWDILHRGLKTSKAKHVRWTPSVLAGGSPNAQMSSVDPFESFNESVPGLPRSKVSSLVQTFGDVVESGNAEGKDLKGKGKEKVAPQDAGDELAWYAMEAIESLRQMRSKPASAV